MMLWARVLLCLIATVPPNINAAVPQSWIQGYKKGHFLYIDSNDTPSAPQIGNGYVATFSATGTEHIAGVFNGKAASSAQSHRADIPASTDISLNLPATAWGLDLQKAVSYRLFSNDVVNITQSWYAHRTRRHVMITEFQIDNGGPATTFNFFSHPSKSADITFTQHYNTSTVTGFTASTILPEEPTTPLTKICVATTPLPNSVNTPGGKTTIVRLYSVRYTSLPNDHEGQVVDEDLWTVCQTALHEVSKMDPTHLLEEHVQAWSTLWDSRIEIVGDMELARVVNASEYALLSSIRHDAPYSTSPGGLSTDGYHGHSFWDVETWMYPTVALLWPHIATGNMIQYRFQRIPAAEHKAEGYGYKGAMYPWESAFTGNEACPGEEGKYENHITGDIALAVWQYYALSGNHTWLQHVGWPMLNKMCTFWTSRVVGDTTVGYSIDAVQPPDEFHYPVNNSVYTNYAAAQTCRFAIRSAKTLSITYPPVWDDIVAHMILLFDKNKMVHPEFAGYFKESGKAALVKQADVVMLPYPWQLPMPKQVATNDLNFYANVTVSSGPAMTWSIFSIGYLYSGDIPNGNKYFLKAFKQYVQKPFNLWWEVRAAVGCKNFITGVGGFLQNLYAGWIGLRIQEGKLVVRPTGIPDGSTGINVRGIRLLGNAISLYQTETSLSMELDSKGSVELVVCREGEKLPFPQHLSYPFTKETSITTSMDCH